MITKKLEKSLKRTFAFALSLVMLLVICPVIHGQADEVSTYDVGIYKGDKESSQWTYPTQEGKVFAGWYTDETYQTVYTGTTGNACAKFVGNNLLTVKKQLNSSASYDSNTANIRFLTAIDSLAYSNVTFHVAMPATNKQWTMTEQTAYSSILVDGAAYPYTAAEVFGEGAAYFVVHTLKNIPQSAFDNEIQVSVSWQTLDGTVVTNAQSNITVDGEVDYKDGVTTLFKANFEDSTTSDSGKVLDTLTADGWDDYSRNHTSNGEANNSRVSVVESKGSNTTKNLRLTTQGSGAARTWLEKKINVTGLDNVTVEFQYYMEGLVSASGGTWYPHLQLKCANGNADTGNATTPRVYYRAYETGALNTWISIKVELTSTETEGTWAVKTYMKDAQGVWVQATLGEVTEIEVTNNEMYLCFFAYLRKGVSKDLTEAAGGTLDVPQQSCFVDNIRIYTTTE